MPFDGPNAIVARLLLQLVAALPLAVVHALGALAGELTFWLSPTYRRRLRANLDAAGYHDRGLVRAAAREAGKQGLETPWVWLRPPADIVAITTFDGTEVLDAALAEDRPVMILTPHLGCFEIIAQHYAATRASAGAPPMTVLYRIPRKAILRDLVESGRAADGLRLAPAELRGVRLLMRAMKQREVVGILPDQVPSRGDGVWAPFFNRWAYTMTLPAKLGVQFNGIMLFLYGERLAGGAGYRIHCTRLAQTLTGDAGRDARTINRELEALIRRCPAQYLWGYNRYKAPADAEPAPQTPA